MRLSSVRVQLLTESLRFIFSLVFLFVLSHISSARLFHHVCFQRAQLVEMHYFLTFTIKAFKQQNNGGCLLWNISIKLQPFNIKSGLLFFNYTAGRTSEHMCVCLLLTLTECLTLYRCRKLWLCESPQWSADTLNTEGEDNKTSSFMENNSKNDSVGHLWRVKETEGQGKQSMNVGKRAGRREGGRGRRGDLIGKRSQGDCRNPERICQLLLALILMEASAPLPLTHLALIPALLSKLFKL